METTKKKLGQIRADEQKKKKLNKKLNFRAKEKRNKKIK
jgi:hypothetical protein